MHLIESPNHYQNFIDAVKARKGAVSPLPDAVRSDIISQLCDIAIRLKRKVTWDPKKEVIVGDAEASKMMLAADAGAVDDLSTDPPLPPGEGWGEGKLARIPRPKAASAGRDRGSARQAGPTCRGIR